MSNTILNKITYLIKLIKEGKIKQIWTIFFKRIYSEQKSFGFKRSLNVDFKKPRTLIAITLREFNEKDKVFFSMDNSNNGLIDEFKTCYVLTTKDDIPTFRCWAIDASQNEKLKRVWKGTFPDLNKDEILLESAYTIPNFRGMGLHPSAMYLVSEKCKEFGAKFAISFAYIENISSLRSFNYSGFSPYLLRKEKWFMFKKIVTFQEIPNNMLDYYNKSINRKSRIKA